jgi:hypothetical protein
VELIDLLYQVLASPTVAFRLVSQKKPLGWAIGVAFLSSFVVAFVLLPYPPRLAEVIFGLERGSLNAAPWWFLWLSVFLVILVVEAGFVHVVALLFRCKGSYLGMLCALCFASFPLVLFAPLALLRALLASSTGYLLYYVGSAILYPWILILDTIAIRHNYQASVTKAAAICFIAVFLMFILPMLIVAIAMAT